MSKELSYDIKEIIGRYDKYRGLQDIYVNSDGSLYIQTGKRVAKHKNPWSSERIENFIHRIADYHDTVINANSPIFSGALPNGYRVECLVHPAVDHPVIAIRVPYSKVIPLKKICKTQEYKTIVKAIIERENIIVSGATGSGKTTLVNSIIDRIPKERPGERLLIIEDTKELITNKIRNKVSIILPPHRAIEGLYSALRLRPSAIIFGEVRYGVVADTLLKAWETGHSGGICTIHANSAEDTIRRFEDLLYEEVKNETLIKRKLERLRFVIYMEKQKIKKIVRRGK